MPYTPPSTRSPGSSPETSRRPSLQQSSPRPVIPRSASYLTRQPRRSNSWSEKTAEKTASSNTRLNGGHPPSTPPSILSQTTPPDTSDDLQSLLNNSVIRQSPPPITDGRSMPQGAIISPPESLNSSSDEGEEPSRGRSMHKQIKALQEAISQIPQHRSMSPPRKGLDDVTANPLLSSALPSDMHLSFSTGSLVGLGGRNRRIAHTKSKTESNIQVVFSTSSGTGSEEDSEDELREKPIMVRKKSGELVRPALRAPSRKRPSSMPGTPTFAKNVHFDSCLEQVRHFCDVDRPSAVSVGSSPADTYDTDDEFPFQSAKRLPAFEWDLVLNNFPTHADSRASMPVRMERVWLSADQKSLMGSVVVANLAFQKFIACRFTLDYWKTTSEVVAEYSHEVRPREGYVGHDRFTFSIKLSDTANLETKTLYFSVRYNVDGKEFWDNNSHANFQVDFKKKMLPQNGKHGFQGAFSRPVNSLPRSNRRPTSGSNRKTSSALSDFSEAERADRKSIREALGDTGSMSGLRLKGVKSTPSIASDNLSNGLSSPSGQAFSNRYDFGASLSAAKQAAKDTSNPMSDQDPDGLYMKPNRRGEAATAAKLRKNDSAVTPTKPTAPHMPPKSAVPALSTNSIASASYEEILNKYCFFGSKQASLAMKDRAKVSPASIPKSHNDKLNNKTEAACSHDDAAGSRSPSSTSSCSSSISERLGEPTAQHHSLYPVDSGHYYYAGPLALSPSSPADQLGSRSSSPASLGTGFAPLAGMSSHQSEYQSLLCERFPVNTEICAATTIRG